MAHTPEHRARVGDPDKLAADANRTVAARAPQPVAAPQQFGASGSFAPDPRPSALSAGFSSLKKNLSELPGRLTRSLTASAAESERNALVGSGGVFNAPFTTSPRPAGFGSGVGASRTFDAPPDLGAIPADPPFHIGPQPVTAIPEVAPGFSIEGPVQQPGGFSLADLLSAAGPARSGLGTIAGLGLGSALVAQEESQIQTGLSRERTAAADVRAGQELESQITSRGAQAGVAEASAEKIETENRINALRISQGLPLTGAAGAETFRTSVIPADIVSGTPAQLLRAGSRGGSELRPAAEGGFSAGAAVQGRDPIAVRIAAIDSFKAANPAFKDSTDQEVLIELQRQFDEQGAQ